MHDIKSIIASRIIGQYKDSPVISSLLNSLSSEYEFIHSEVRRTIDERNFLNAQNVNLNIIGSIVGIGREVTDFVETDYFSFLQDPTGKGFESLNEKVVAGRYRSSDENTVTTRKLIDSEYRILISAKILKNISNITSNDVLLITREILNLMYPNITINVDIKETGNASFKVIINYILTPAEKSFIASLDLIPRPVGVKIEYVYEDIDIDLGVNYNVNLSDTAVSISSSVPLESIVSLQLEDAINSMVANVIEAVSLNAVLSDTIVSIQVAPPGSASASIQLGDSISAHVLEIEEKVSLENTLQDSNTAIVSTIDNEISFILQGEDSIVLANINAVTILDTSNVEITNADGSNWEIE